MARRRTSGNCRIPAAASRESFIAAIGKKCEGQDAEKYSEQDCKAALRHWHVCSGSSLNEKREMKN